jgi:signal transduction histidine kinase
MRAPCALDAVLAAGLAIWWIAELGELSLIGGAALVLTTVPLAWRRTVPLGSMALIAAGFVLSTAEPSPPEPLAQLLAVLIASYSVTVHAPTGRAAVAGCGLALGAGLAAGLIVGDDVLFILVLVGVASAAGAVVRRLGSRSTELERRAERLDERARTAAADERERIARELHDIVSHSVSLMVVQAGAAQQVLRRDPDQAEHALSGIQATGRAAIDDLRRMLGLLRGSQEASALTPQPGLAALEGLVASVRHSGTPVQVDVGSVPPLPAGIDLAAYRIVQEAVTNAAKHAPGCATRVRVGCEQGRLVLEALTSGPPRTNGAGNGSGHGLIGMRERVAIYGGELQAGFDERADWVVRASIPLEAP